MRWAIAIGGTLLLAVGLAVWLQGVEYSSEREVLDVGPLEAKVEEKHSIPRMAGVVAAIGGVVLIAVGLAGRKT